MPSDYVATFGDRALTLHKHPKDVLDRIKDLKQARDEVLPDMQRTAEVLSGGQAAVQALLANHPGQKPKDLPIANYVRDAIDALAGRIGVVPELRVDAPRRGNKSDRDEPRVKHAEKRERIVAHFDEYGHGDPSTGTGVTKLGEVLPQLGRWVPGAAYMVTTIDPIMHGGHPYPLATHHYPLNTMLAQWTPLQNPQDVGFIERVPLRELIHLYPHAENELRKGVEEREGGGVILGTHTIYGKGVEVVRYYDRHGTWVFAPDKELLLDFRENPLESGPSFVSWATYAYSRLRGEFDDLLGVMISMARLQIAAEIAVIDDIHQPVNLFLASGNQPLSGPYKRGRGKTNVFEAQDKVEIPQRTIQHQAWQQFDRLERQLNIGATVPQQDRGESPMSFVTGRGLANLGARVDRKVREYQTIFASAIERVDAKMLEYDERAWPDIAKPMQGTLRQQRYADTYRPKTHIAGNYRTSRHYGALAGAEEAVKLNGLAVMDSAQWVSKRWIRSQLDGIGLPESEMTAQIEEEQNADAFRQLLLAHAMNPDSPEHQRAVQLFVEQLPAGPTKRLAEKWLTERGDKTPQDELEALMAQMGPQAAGPPPDPATVLAGMTAGGEARGGAQRVGRLGP